MTAEDYTTPLSYEYVGEISLKFLGKTFGGFSKSRIFAASFQKAIVSRKLEGRLAQLVQSICLTSRGSGVRIPQRPLIIIPTKSSGV